MAERRDRRVQVAEGRSSSDGAVAQRSPLGAPPPKYDVSASTSHGAQDPVSSLRIFRLAWTLVWTSGRRSLILILAATATTSLALAGQLLVGRSLLDLLAGSAEVNTADLVPRLVALGVLLLASALSQAVATELRVPLGEEAQRRAMNDIIDVATEVSLEDFERPEFHNRFRLAAGGAGGHSSRIVFGLVNIVSTLMIAVGIVLVLVAVAPILVPISVAGYLPIAYVNLRNNRERYELERSLTELQRERTYLEFLLTAREAATETRAYGLSGTLRGWHSENWDVRLRRLRILVRRRLLLSGAGSAVTTVVLIGTLSVAVALAARGSLSLGDAAVAVVGLQQLSSRLRGAGTAFSGIHNGITFMRDFQRFRDELPRMREERPTDIPPTPPNVISTQALSYRYPGGTEDVLRSVSFEIRRGQIVAVVGANGSGKTTLSKLVCGLLPAERGAVRWDGVDIGTCDPDLVRAQIAPVFQDYIPYMLTLRQVIGLGDVTRMDDDSGIMKAIEDVGLGELVAAHDTGLDVRLGKMYTGGIDVSVGQWQRLAIARALFRDAPILVLDEPSASLDPRAEAELFDLLHSLCADRMVLFVSHRFATVRSADAVVVLDHGEIVEMGHHDDLMKAGGLYHELFEVQAARYGL